MGSIPIEGICVHLVIAQLVERWTVEKHKHPSVASWIPASLHLEYTMFDFSAFVRIHGNYDEWLTELECLTDERDDD